MTQKCYDEWETQLRLCRDGKEILRGTEIEIWDYLHREHCYSVSHALRYEGYNIEPWREAGFGSEADYRKAGGE